MLKHKKIIEVDPLQQGIRHKLNNKDFYIGKIDNYFRGSKRYIKP